jgi:hypothetical protein
MHGGLLTERRSRDETEDEVDARLKADYLGAVARCHADGGHFIGSVSGKGDREIRLRGAQSATLPSSSLAFCRGPR